MHLMWFALLFYKWIFLIQIYSFMKERNELADIGPHVHTTKVSWGAIKRYSKCYHIYYCNVDHWFFSVSKKYQDSRAFAVRAWNTLPLCFFKKLEYDFVHFLHSREGWLAGSGIQLSTAELQGLSCLGRAASKSLCRFCQLCSWLKLMLHVSRLQSMLICQILPKNVCWNS